jgi:hypothetical protein
MRNCTRNRFAAARRLLAAVVLASLASAIAIACGSGDREQPADARSDVEGRREILVRWGVLELRAGEFVCVRAVQEDGGAAWSSPWFVE